MCAVLVGVALTSGIARPDAYGSSPALGTAFGRQLRPVAKSALKAGMAATERLRELGAEAVEQTHDLVAEARHEREQERSRPAEIAEAPARRQRAAPESKPG